jgi:hypothetical protein
MSSNSSIKSKQTRGEERNTGSNRPSSHVFPSDAAQQHEAKEYKTGKKKSKLLTTCEKLPPESNRPKSFTTGDDHIRTTTTTTAGQTDRQTDALTHVRKRKRKNKVFFFF